MHLLRNNLIIILLCIKISKEETLHNPLLLPYKCPMNQKISITRLLFYCYHQVCVLCYKSEEAKKPQKHPVCDVVTLLRRHIFACAADLRNDGLVAFIGRWRGNPYKINEHIRWKFRTHLQAEMHNVPDQPVRDSHLLNGKQLTFPSLFDANLSFQNSFNCSFQI